MMHFCVERNLCIFFIVVDTRHVCKSDIHGVLQLTDIIELLYFTNVRVVLCNILS